MAGYRNQPAGAPSDVEWFPLDAAWFASPTIDAGASITVVSAWAFSGNNAACQFSSTGADDGLREGYLARCDIAPLLALLGTTQSRIDDGLDAILAWVVPKQYPGARALGLVGICDANGTHTLINGGAGGYRGSTTVGEVAATTQDRSIENTGQVITPGVVADGDAFGVSIECAETYVQIKSKGNIKLSNTTGSFASSNGARTSTLNRLCINAGTTLINSGPTFDVDLDVWFALRAGERDNRPG